MATHSGILVWRISWRRAWQATVHVVDRVGHDLATEPYFNKTHFYHQKFEAIDRPSVTAQFYLESKGKSLRREGGLIQKMRREESQRLNFGSSFYGSVSSP